jgi:two-component system CheB/CheR fusion protein
LELVSRGTIRPDLVLADYNLPGGLTGLQLAARLREKFHSELPIIILTGDISTATLHGVAAQNCVQLNKPVKLNELAGAIDRLLAKPSAPAARQAPRAAQAPRDAQFPTIFVVDDDDDLRASLRSVLENAGRRVEDFASCEAFLAAYRPGGEACLLIDAYLPGMNGFELLRHIRDSGNDLPAIMITGSNDVPTAVQAMKAGASDFIVKPIGYGELLESVDRALEHSKDASKLFAHREEAARHVADLTARQRQIMDMVLAGHPSKNIAADLGISQRTVENHRASIMKRTGSKSLPALARLALAASARGGDEPGV